MPCFDQPDLKAPFKLTCLAPSDWLVVSNEGEQRISTEEQAPEKFASLAKKFGNLSLHKMYEFPPTLPISTYLYAVMAGPYEYKADTDPNTGLPLKIYARKGLIKYVLVEEMFKITKCGLKFYEDFFGVKYPFSKYEMIFIPDHLYVAMENVGCVTFSENKYLFVDHPASLS